jgi:hypothetical protein
MMECARIAIEAVEKLHASEFPNPYDPAIEQAGESDLFLDGSDDDSGLEPHRR